MYEFHGWFGLAETTEEADVGGLAPALADLKTLLSRFTGTSVTGDVTVLNGQYFVTVTGMPNRERRPGEAGTVDDLLDFLAERLPGSWGILYERAVGANEFRVRVLARGVITRREDPFLSPCNPTIED